MLLSLEAHYNNINWHLLTNEDFVGEVLYGTLERAGSMADTAELFVRSAKLLELGGALEARCNRKGIGSKSPRSTLAGDENGSGIRSSPNERLQPLVQGLMKTLLDDYPTLLDSSLLSMLLDNEYCKRSIGLRMAITRYYGQRKPAEKLEVTADTGKKFMAELFLFVLSGAKVPPSECQMPP